MQVNIDKKVCELKAKEKRGERLSQIEIAILHHLRYGNIHDGIAAVEMLKNIDKFNSL